MLARPKFDAYITIAERQEFLRLLLRVVEWVPVTCSIRACRDPKDNKFLELAVSGNALTIVTGDKDPLALDPFHSLRILRPAEFLDQAHAIRGPE